MRTICEELLALPDTYEQDAGRIVGGAGDLMNYILTTPAEGMAGVVLNN